MSCAVRSHEDTPFESTLGLEHSRRAKFGQALVDLYDAWYEAEPDTDHDIMAAEWRAELEQAQLPEDVESEATPADDS